MPAVMLACSRCRVSGPLFALTGGVDSILSEGILRRGNHFHMLGMWMQLPPILKQL
jgi:hypothetical protein